MGLFTYLLNSANEVVVNQGSIGIDGSATATQLGGANALILPISLPWRTQGVSSQYLELDFGAAISVNTAAVINTNVTSGAATFRFRGGATSPANEVDFNLTLNGRRNAVHLAVATSAKRYWRLEVTDAANPDGYIEAGYIVLGVRSAWTWSFLNEWARTRRIVNRASGSGLSVALVGDMLSDTHAIELAFENLHASGEADALEDWIDSLQGGKNPMLFAPDPDDTDNVYFGRMESPQEFEVVRKNKGFTNVDSLVLVEDNPGLRIPDLS